MGAFARVGGTYESVKSTAVLEKMILHYQNKWEQNNMEWNWFLNYLKSQESFTSNFFSLVYHSSAGFV